MAIRNITLFLVVTFLWPLKSTTNRNMPLSQAFYKHSSIIAKMNDLKAGTNQGPNSPGMITTWTSKMCKLVVRGTVC